MHMPQILGVSFETPSVKELDKVEKLIRGTALIMYDEGSDYLKLIKDRNNTLLGVYNKKNNNVLFLEKIDDDKKEKILNLIK